MTKRQAKCPHCLRAVETDINGRIKPHMNQSSKLCQPKAGAAQAAGNYSGYKKGS